MVHEHEHLIVVHLNSTGFNAEDIEELRPDFEAPSGNDRPVRYELQWASSAMGPCSFEMSIVIYASLSAVSAGFLAALGSDLYKWAKAGLREVFTRRSSGEGDTIIKFDDKAIHIEYHPSEESFQEVWKELPELLSLISDHDGRIWRVSKNEFGKFTLLLEDE